jgi:DNA-directed RNA polymerase II subunit RPB1
MLPDERWNKVFQIASKIKRCGEATNDGCGCKQPSKIKKENLATLIAEWDEVDTSDAEKTKISLNLTPEKVVRLFRRITDDNIKFMGFSPIWSRPEWMVCQVLAVPPPSVRPSVKYDSSQRSEDDLTYILVQIMRINKTLQEKIAQNAPATVLEDHHTMLQYFIASLVDNKIPNAKPAAQRSGRAFKSIKDRLNGKTGRVRGNLMGKRVDFSARSVITSDPYIDIDQVGISKKIAMELTIPEEVTPYNIKHLTGLIKNGKEVYPGANFVLRLNYRDGKPDIQTIYLKYRKKDIRLKLGDIVERHSVDGDYVLFNRQPTLHKPSMMGHKIQVIDNNELNTFTPNGDCFPVSLMAQTRQDFLQRYYDRKYFLSLL